MQIYMDQDWLCNILLKEMLWPIWLEKGLLNQIILVNYIYNLLGLKIHTNFYDKMSFNDYIGTNRPFDVDENLALGFAKKFD